MTFDRAKMILLRKTVSVLQGRLREGVPLIFWPLRHLPDRCRAGVARLVRVSSDPVVGAPVPA